MVGDDEMSCKDPSPKIIEYVLTFDVSTSF